MLSRGVIRQTFLFCAKSQNPQPTSTTDANALSKSEKQQDIEIPLHLRPYNK
jgi:hypothetical protein